MVTVLRIYFYDRIEREKTREESGERRVDRDIEESGEKRVEKLVCEEN